MAGRDPRLEAQLEHLRSDDRLRERAARASALGPAERMALVEELARAAMELLDRLPADVRARVEAYREPLGPDAERVLKRLGTLASPD